MQSELRHFLNSRYGKMQYEIVQKGSESKGNITIKWPTDQVGLITPALLSAKLRVWFSEQMPGKPFSVSSQKTKLQRSIKISFG